MASGKALNLVASFITGRIALRVFQEDNLGPFRIFLGFLAALTLFLFGMADSMIQGTWLWQSCRRLRYWTPLQILMQKWYPDAAGPTPVKHSKENNDVGASSSNRQQPRKLHWRRIVRDFSRHHNFRVWVVMEMLLHMQITFNANFLKTFVDNLLLPDYGRDTCDWLLSLVGPLSQLVTIFAYIPIQKWGYPKMYLILFASNLFLSNLLYWFVGETSSLGILIFLMVYSVSTRAVQSAGFHLAMADMVLEMKRKHASDGRYDEPSVAGLFMGANALLCVGRLYAGLIDCFDFPVSRILKPIVLVILLLSTETRGIITPHAGCQCYGIQWGIAPGSLLFVSSSTHILFNTSDDCLEFL
jgi:Na+/melibiose symporter-like transporter